MAKDPKTNIPNPRPARNCTSCPHGRTQHSTQGCTWSEKKNGTWVECRCTVRYMDL